MTNKYIKPDGTLSEQVDLLLRERDRLRALLREVEWAGPPVAQTPTCLWCGAQKPTHNQKLTLAGPPCRLAAALKETP